MKEINIALTVYEANNLSELAPPDSALLQEAVKATKNSYAPYSKFNVGAAVLLDNGEVIHGSNQENAAYPSGLCAERVALFYANARYPNVAVKAIAINAATDGKQSNEPVYPCGNCRQVLLECENRFGKPVKIIMGSAGKIQIVNSIKDLLPLSYTLKSK
jgi:cytidine deaminase